MNEEMNELMNDLMNEEMNEEMNDEMNGHCFKIQVRKRLHEQNSDKPYHLKR